jgi:hypothetical protein
MLEQKHMGSVRSKPRHLAYYFLFRAFSLSKEFKFSIWLLTLLPVTQIWENSENFKKSEVAMDFVGRYNE